jgi:hypothetical protein
VARTGARAELVVVRASDRMNVILLPSTITINGQQYGTYDDCPPPTPNPCRTYPSLYPKTARMLPMEVVRAPLCGAHRRFWG